MTPSLYRLLADAVLALHLAVVGFVVFGLLAIFVGRARWPWVRKRWLRVLHLLAIAVVTLQAWFGWICPLTTLEMALRQRAGEASYAGAFIAHWLQMLLYYEAPIWVFALVYSAFGLLVLASWFMVPPRPWAWRRPAHAPCANARAPAPAPEPPAPP
jgi:hypothetical protein